MTYAVVGLVLALLAALLYAFLKGRENGELRSEIEYLERYRLSSEKAIYVLSRLTSKEAQRIDIKKELNDAQSNDDFQRLYDKITTIVRTDSDTD